MNKLPENGEQIFANYWNEVFPVETGLRSTGIVEVKDEEVELCSSYFKSKNICFEVVNVARLNEEREKRGADPFMAYMNENLFYIGDNDRKVKNLIECDFNNDFFCVGMMLGYPECCIVAFFGRGTESVDIERIKKTFPLAVHIPCSENCEKTAVYCGKLQKDIDAYKSKIR